MMWRCFVRGLKIKSFYLKWIENVENYDILCTNEMILVSWAWVVCQEYIATMQILAYDITFDAIDEYVQLASSTSMHALIFYIFSYLFGLYTRAHTLENHLEKILKSK